MKLNKKGFTLVELLAVIVVLALLMVVAASSIGTALTNAKKNTLKTETQKVITSVYQEAQSAKMLNSSDLIANISVNATATSGLTTKSKTETCSDTTKLTETDCIAASKTWTKKYEVKGKDGDYDYIVRFDKDGNITDYIVNYKEEMSIKIESITEKGAPKVPDAVTIKDGKQAF